MLAEFMSLMSVPEKLQEFISLVMEAADRYQETEEMKALKNVDVAGRKKAEETIDDAVIVGNYSVI